MRLGMETLDVTGSVVWVPSHHSTAASSSRVVEPTYWWMVALVLFGGGVLALRGRRVVTP
jgi:hypothetical protein